MDGFLDRLMHAESGGRSFAKNPNSTALGPFQFIASTWLQVMRNHFADEIAPLSAHQILSLRTDQMLARRAADSFTRENAARLVAQGHPATFPNLRLAFLVGAGAAVRVLNARPETPAGVLLGATVIGANPFMSRMTAADLLDRCAREVEGEPKSMAGLVPESSMVLKAKAEGTRSAVEADDGQGKKTKQAAARIEIDCDLSRSSCRKWLALAERRVTRRRRASR